MGNITENKLNTTITPADLLLIKTSLATIASKLPEGSLTEDQRSNLLSMDVDNKIFAEDCMNEISISGTGIIPTFINPEFIQNDIALYEQLDLLGASVENLLQKINDLKRICADETMTTSNAIYKMYEMANVAGVAGAKQAYDKLKARYAKNNTNPPVANA